MKNSDEDQSSSEHGFVKHKWCDSMYFLAMDQDMTHTNDKTLRADKNYWRRGRRN